MKDRVVEHPARYKLEPVAGTTDTFDLTPVPGTVTEEGDDLNKSNLLTDDTCAALDIPTTSVPNDAFFILSIGNNRALVAVTVYETGTTTPIPNVLVNGIKTSTGADIYTNENGYAAGFTSTATTTIGVNAEYVDLTTTQTSKSTPLGKKTTVTIYATRKTNSGYLETTVTSAAFFRFTDRVIVDVHAVGGGSNGGTGMVGTGYLFCGSGGAGGKQKYTLNITPNPLTRYQAIIGAANGGAASSFLGVSSSAGLNGGVGGNGFTYVGVTRNATNGGNCTVQKYGTGAVVASGGGGGGSPASSVSAVGGSVGGGTGSGLGTGSINGGNATYYGGGGGGAGFQDPTFGTGGTGYQGVVWFRWRYAS